MNEFYDIYKDGQFVRRVHYFGLMQDLTRETGVTFKIGKLNL